MDTDNVHADCKKALERLRIECEEKTKGLISRAVVMQATLKERIDEAQLALKKQVSELEKMNEFMINRELKMAELKKENEDLREKLSFFGSSPKT